MANRNRAARTGVVVCAIVACLVAAKTRGQSQSPAPPPQQNPTAAGALHVTTRAVQVSVIAQDSDGHPIPGLTQDDFTILDGGIPQKIVSFTQNSARLTADVTSGARPASPNTFSNRLDEKTGVFPSVTVILLDALNTDFHDMASARGQVVKFLRQIRPEDRVALYELTTKLVVLHDFTSDTSTLLRALGESTNPQNGAPAETPQVSPETEDSLLNPRAGVTPAPDPGWLTAELERESVFDQKNKVEGTTDTFIEIARHLARLPGRKNLVWVSGSFPINIDWSPGKEAPSFVPQVTDAARAMSDANVAIYPVDARGLVAQSMDQPGVLFAKHKPGAPVASTLDTMQALAHGTGGVAFYNTNDLGGAIRRAIDDSALTYELTYYPTNEKWDGRFREIKVEVKHPGASLRYRKGYFATAATASDPRSQARLMTAAARDPLEATQLGLTVQVSATDAPGPRHVKVEVRVDPDQLHFDLNAGRWNDSVEVAWIELDAKGTDIGHGEKTMTLTYPDAEHDKVAREGLTFANTIGLMDECVELRLVARDGGTGAIGSVNIPLGRIFKNAGVAVAPKN